MDKILFRSNNKIYSVLTNLDVYGVSQYKFEDNDSTIKDSISGKNGTAMGTTIVDGYNGGKARYFNGTSDFISFNNYVIPIGKKSIRFKIKAPSQSLNARLIDNSGNSANYGMQILVRSNGGIEFNLHNGVSGTNYNSIKSTKIITDDQWHDILYVWDGTKNENGIKLYVDDMVTPDSVATATVAETRTPTNSLTIGKNAGAYTPALYFKGIIDDLEIYNDVIDGRSEGELLEINSATLQEKHFVDYGAKEVDMIKMYKHTMLNRSSGMLGVGKTFEHTINLSKRRVDKIILN